MNKHARICIIGPGAIGGVLAGILVRKGFQVHLVCKYEDLAKKISSTGIEVLGHKGNFTVPVPSFAAIDQLEGEYDYAFMATKAEALKETATALLPYLSNYSRVISMQNGICEEILAEVVGEQRTVGCVVGWGGTMHAPGKVEMTSGGECILGNWKRKPDRALEELREILGHVVETRTTPHILSELYSKLIINACITTLGAVCGLYLGPMLAKKHTRNLFIQIIREAMKVAEAMALRVEPGAGGKLDYYKFLKPGRLSEFKRHMTIRVIGMKYRRLKSSSLQSLERGRKTEVDNYNGYISAKGFLHDVPTPINDQLVRMVKEIEEGKRKINPKNLLEIKSGPA
jgi:2-dehydropantoate 2-reductase